MSNKANKSVALNFYIFISFLFLAIICYHHTLDAPFYFDGIDSILNNPIVHHSGNSLSVFFDHTPGRALLFLSFRVNYLIGGYSPVGFRIVNILFHLANAYMLYLLMVNLFIRFAEDQKNMSITDLLQIRLACYIVATIFLCHPIQVESVTYIWQRSTCMVTTFFLFSCLMYLYFRQTRTYSSFCLTIVSLICAMYTKQNSVTFPLLILFIEAYISRGKVKEIKKQILPLSIILLLTLIVPLTILLMGDPSVDKVNKVIKSHNSFEYFLTQAKVRFFYFKLLVFPTNFSLHHHIEATRSIFDWKFFLPITVELLLCFQAARHAKKSLVYIFAIAGFYISMAVESSFFPLEDLAFEHRIYLPLVFLLMVLAPIIMKVAKWNIRFLYSTSFLVLAGLCFQTYQHNLIWQSSTSLWSNIKELNPQSKRAFEHFFYNAVAKGNFEEAEMLMLELNEDKKNTNFLEFYRAVYFLQQGDLQSAKVHFLNSRKFSMNSIPVLLNLALININEGNLEEAGQYVRSALKHGKNIGDWIDTAIGHAVLINDEKLIFDSLQKTFEFPTVELSSVEAAFVLAKIFNNSANHRLLEKIIVRYLLINNTPKEYIKVILHAEKHKNLEVSTILNKKAHEKFNSGIFSFKVAETYFNLKNYKESDLWIKIAEQDCIQDKGCNLQEKIANLKDAILLAKQPH